MTVILDHPLAVFAIGLVAMVLGALAGIGLARHGILGEDEHEYFGMIQTATLTLLGLVVGFICNFMVKAVHARFHMRDDEAERAAMDVGAVSKPAGA